MFKYIKNVVSSELQNIRENSLNSKKSSKTIGIRMVCGYIKAEIKKIQY